MKIEPKIKIDLPEDARAVLDILCAEALDIQADIEIAKARLDVLHQTAIEVIRGGIPELSDWEFIYDIRGGVIPTYPSRAT